MKKEHGIAMVLAPHVKVDNYTIHLDARIMSARVRVRGLRLALLVIYSPTNAAGERDDTPNVAFYAALKKAMKAMQEKPSYKVVILGDFNATIGANSKSGGAWDQILGKNNPDRVDTNANGEKMLEFCQKFDLKILNSLFSTKRIHRETWRHAATGRWKRVDYICMVPWLAKLAQNCRVYTQAANPLNTDHRMVIAFLRVPMGTSLKHYCLNQKRSAVAPKLDFGALRDDTTVQRDLTTALDKALDVNTYPLELDALNEHITENVRKCAEAVCPTVEVQRQKDPWDDAKLLELVAAQRRETNHARLRKLQKETKRYREKLKNEYFERLANSINTAAEARAVEKEFSLAKKYKSLKTSTRLTISKDKLREHFTRHFSGDGSPTDMPDELSSPEKYPEYADEPVDINESPPTIEEVKRITKSFKNGKSAGTDKLKMEILRYNESENLIAMLVILLGIIWATVSVPTAWLHSNIVCLFKKGTRSEAKNYRGLSIGANLSRLLPRIIVERFEEAYEKGLSQCQFGFRRNRSTADAIYIVREVIQKASGTYVVVYIDLTAAYDHIPRNFLFAVLKHRLIKAPKLLALLYTMYVHTTAAISGMRQRFSVLVGCRQGGQESPVLFNYYFDYVLKICAAEIDRAFPDGWGLEFEFEISHLCTNRDQRSRGKMRGIEIIRWILYADDLALFCRTIDEARKLLEIIERTCKKFGLKVSFKKTKTQVFHDEELATVATHFSIADEPVENVRDFVYLGHMITNREDCCFTELRTSRAVAKFSELSKCLTDTAINLGTRRKLLEACVRSRLLYATQAWYPNAKEINVLETCWYGCLRRMVTGGFRRKKNPETGEQLMSFKYTNADLERIARTPPLRDFIKVHYLKYIAHICRGENTLLTKKMMFAKPQKAYYRDPWIKISQMIGVDIQQAKKSTQDKTKFAELLRHNFPYLTKLDSESAMPMQGGT